MNKFKIDFDYIIYMILFGIIGFLSYEIIQINKVSKDHVCVLDYYKEENAFKTIFYDQTIESLKEENRQLYDSIKLYKDEIDYLLQFKYQKEYIIDTVYCDSSNTSQEYENEKVYEYTNQPNDTLNYTLQIGSLYEPNWYKLKLMVSDNFTIINKKYDDINITTIDPYSNNATISDVTVFNKKEKHNFFDNFKFGPSVTTGYDIINKKMGLMVGVSVIYEIPLD